MCRQSPNSFSLVFPSLLYCILIGSSFVSLSNAIVIGNENLRASLGPSGVLQYISSAQSHTVHHFENDSWSVEVSDFNVTTHTSAITPENCSAVDVFNVSVKGATFRHYCSSSALLSVSEPTTRPSNRQVAPDSWIVDLTYSIPEGANYLKKQIRLCGSLGTSTFLMPRKNQVCSSKWRATIRAVNIWRGLSIVGGSSTYTGQVVFEPTANDFHPLHNHRPNIYPGYGVKAQYIAGFYRRASHNDGLFVSIMNPFGEYTSPKVTVPRQTQIQSNEIWEVHAQYACDQSPAFKFKFLPFNQTLKTCESACLNYSDCVMFELDSDPSSQSHWCALYNTSNQPQRNNDYTCVCRGTCPGSPGPPGPHPTPGPPSPRPNTTIPPVIWARFEPEFLHTTAHDAFFVAEAAIIGVTDLQKYPISASSQINIGEAVAFRRAVETTLMDAPSPTQQRGPVRVQVGWDSNDYQIDIGTEAGRVEYKRMLRRDGLLGVTHAIFAPRNSLRSQRANATDAWGWEEALWLGMGEQIRIGNWLPQEKGTFLPPEIKEMVEYAALQNVSLLAYAYPVLPFLGAEAEPRNKEGWLYDGVRGANGQYQPRPNIGPSSTQPNCTQPGTATDAVCSDTRASLANVAFQNYLAETLIAFVKVSGCGGFAWDYTSFNDWRQPTDYAEWRGWQRILKILRLAHPDIVMDHRQQSHNWGPWGHAAGSYTEPIAGDENPESYGAAGESGIPTLSTDAVLANNLRRVNNIYRSAQLLPNVRIPGFMSHQSERHFDDGQSPATLNFSAVHRRDFDYQGFAYSLLSSIGTAGLNSVVAMLPARDVGEFNAFNATVKGEWIRKWFDFAEAESACWQNTIPIIAPIELGSNTNLPRIGALDGTASFLDDDSHGFLFLFNPGPRSVCSTIRVDEGMGISNGSTSSWFLAHEIYPREENSTSGLQTPVGLWNHGSVQQICVAAQSAKVLRVSKIDNATDSKQMIFPLVLNLSYVNATIALEPSGYSTSRRMWYRVNVTGAVALVGESCAPIVLTQLQNRSLQQIHSVYVNGHLVSNKGPGCLNVHVMDPNIACTTTRFIMTGDLKVRAHAEATDVSPTPEYSRHAGTFFNATLEITSAMKSAIEIQNQAYPVPWSAVDLDAAWLGGRLLLFVYITQPNSNYTIPRIWLNRTEFPVIAAYNSRGYVQEKCFLGYYLDATSLPMGTHQVSLLLPPLNVNASNGTVLSEFKGLFWYGIENQHTSELSAPLPSGNFSECAVVGHQKPDARPLPPDSAKNVLYILVDDLRPELHHAYNQSHMYTPHLDAFSKTATVFNNAFCQIAVCSPSRMSFLSGRRPGTTGIYNFINHIRQATCPETSSSVSWAGQAYRNITIYDTQGAAGECCSQCSKDAMCASWTFVGKDVTDGTTVYLKDDETQDFDYCSLFDDESSNHKIPAKMGTVSGLAGSFSSITPLPQHFRNQGYLTMQSGKIWHTEEGDLYGEGMPPRQDAGLSWDLGCSMADVNAVANMLPCNHMVEGSQGCLLNATLNGTVLDDSGPLCDQIIRDDAISKLRLAASVLDDTGRKFFLAVGFRKPHMPWRLPAAFVDAYPSPSDIVLAQYQTMDASVPPIAHHTPDLQFQAGGDPFNAMNETTAKLDRLYYYASVSWIDSLIGSVLSEVEKLGLVNNTLIVMHSDHGWNLGEHGQWQKFTNWETGVRVPLLIRAPWLLNSMGIRSSTLAELVDIYPTMVDLAGIDGPGPGIGIGTSEILDGVSLGWVLKGTAPQLKTAALSQFPRCPLDANDHHAGWIKNVTNMWQNNWCEFVDRTEFPWMGFSMRTTNWRYTEWVGWDGDNLRPIWNETAGVELYDHRNDDGASFDATENVNVANNHEDIVRQLSLKLHSLFNVA